MELELKLVINTFKTKTKLNKLLEKNPGITHLLQVFFVIDCILYLLHLAVFRLKLSSNLQFIFYNLWVF